MNINKIVLGVNNVVYFWGDERYFATVEAELKKILPSAKTKMGLALKGLNQVRLDYMNNNFQEETTPVLLLSSEEHGQYIASTQ